MASVLKLIKNPAKFVYIWDKLGISRVIPDRAYLKLKYRAALGKKLNLEDPKTYNEKLQWLKLYDRKPEYTLMVDKYEAKKYVAERVGEEYIIPTLGVWDRAEDIDFDSLPNRFVLKCTHDSGGLVICKDKSKLDRTDAIKKLKKYLKTNFYHIAREWPYVNVPRRIIAEQYMEDDQTPDLRDYKVHNFNGEPKFVLVCGNRFSQTGLTEDFYSDKWELMDLKRPKHPNSGVVEEKPEQLEKIFELSNILSKDIPFLRTDFYIVNGKIYFGELTFFPAAGFEAFEPEEWDSTFGNWIELPPKMEKNITD